MSNKKHCLSRYYNNKKFLLGTFWGILLSLIFLQSSYANPPAATNNNPCHTTEFASWTMTGVNSGTGVFGNKTGLPDFTFAATGDLDAITVSNYHSIQDSLPIGFETVFGEADNESHLFLSTQPNYLKVGSPITKKTILTINFNNATPSSGWAFSLMDLEQDQVQIKAVDASGATVPVAVINSWLAGTFDADISLGRAVPFWDATKGALIGNQSPQGTWHYTIPDNSNLTPDEAAGAWFTPNISLSSLTFEMQVYAMSHSTSVHIHLASCKALVDAIDDGETLNKNTAKTIAVLNNDFTTTSFNRASVAVVSAPANGTVIILATGDFLYTPVANFLGTDSFAYEVCDDAFISLCDTAIVVLDVLPQPCMDIQVKIFLEGPMAITNSTEYHTTMRADLNIKRGILPGQMPANPLMMPTIPGHPYNLAPWDYAGEEGTDWTDADYDNIALTYGFEVVDWVLVTLVEADGYPEKVLRAAAVVLQDGTVVFEQDCFTQPSESGLYFLLVEHRNHMGVMTPSPLNLANGLLEFDFTKQDGYLDSPINPTGFGQKEVLPGIFAMFACDGSQITDSPSYDITGRDKIIWTIENGQFDRYLSTDFDLDGDVNGFDKVLWSRNNGISSRVPR